MAAILVNLSSDAVSLGLIFLSLIYSVFAGRFKHFVRFLGVSTLSLLSFVVVSAVYGTGKFKVFCGVKIFVDNALTSGRVALKWIAISSFFYHITARFFNLKSFMGDFWKKEVQSYSVKDVLLRMDISLFFERLYMSLKSYMISSKKENEVSQ